MKPEKEILSECGRILKKVAKILGITVNELEDKFVVGISKITGTKIKKERIHKLFCGEPWPVQYYGISETYSVAEEIARSVLGDGNLYEEKIKEIKLVVYTAFSDYDHLSYFYSNVNQLIVQTGTGDLVDRIMQDISKIDLESIYLLHKYFNAFLSLNFVDLDVLTFVTDLNLKQKLMMPIESISSLLNNPILRQWLEIKDESRKDTLRKVEETQLNKIKQNIKKKLAKCGFSKLLPLACFIEEYLIDGKNGKWAEITKEKLNLLLICKYIIPLDNEADKALKQELFREKLKKATHVMEDGQGGGIVGLDLAAYPGVIWIDFYDEGKDDEP